MRPEFPPFSRSPRAVEHGKVVDRPYTQQRPIPQAGPAPPRSPYLRHQMPGHPGNRPAWAPQMGPVWAPLRSPHAVEHGSLLVRPLLEERPISRPTPGTPHPSHTRHKMPGHPGVGVHAAGRFRHRPHLSPRARAATHPVILEQHPRPQPRPSHEDRPAERVGHPHTTSLYARSPGQPPCLGAPGGASCGPSRAPPTQLSVAIF